MASPQLENGSVAEVKKVGRVSLDYLDCHNRFQMNQGAVEASFAISGA